ncbi:MAG: ATP synthase F1 subunit gamma [Deltaproteobacteria bacterium]|nr:ATP synthase F1 subunit gamma [Deltaproteobacteria bacterium]
MANLRDIRKRIASIKNTQTITRAVQMVAAAKLRRAQENIWRNRAYADKMDKVIASLAGRADRSSHPLLAERQVRNVELVIITGDRGLCGAFNANIMARAEQYMEENSNQYKGFSLICIGNKGWDYFRKRRVNIRNSFRDIMGKVQYENAAVIGEDLIQAFTTGLCDQVTLFYNYFQSTATQVPTVKQLLPFEAGQMEESAVDYLYEPKEKDILNALLPRQIMAQVFRSLLESAAAEHAARMTAMDNATSNCKEIIEYLTTMYNKERQASITREMIDIIGGAEALK